MYYIYTELENIKFKNLYELIKLITEHKEDIIYKSSMPRLKQSKYRGLQAFKQLLNRIHDKQIILNETTKKEYLLGFKLVFNCGSTAFKTNKYDCIVCNHLDELTIKKYNLNQFICSLTEPKQNDEIKEDDKLKIIKDFISEYDLNMNESLKINIWLLNKFIK